jgi:hypothetical protein
MDAIQRLLKELKSGEIRELNPMKWTIDQLDSLKTQGLFISLNSKGMLIVSRDPLPAPDIFAKIS